MIRTLHPDHDLAAVHALLLEAADYWLLSEGTPPDIAAARAFFTDHPPGADPARSLHLGLFLNGTLSGLAELSFGFPDADAAYLGLMILAPRARNAGHGPTLLAEVETRARAAAAPTLYLAVLEANPKGRAFWHRHGFRPTGITRQDDRHITHRLAKPL